MERLTYAVDVTPIPFVGFAGWCRDLPEVHAFGCDPANVLEQMADSMALTCLALISGGRRPPVPTALEPGECWLSASAAALTQPA